MAIFKRNRGGKLSATYWMKFDHARKQIFRDTGEFTVVDAEKVQADLRRALKENRIPDILDRLRARADRTLAHLLDDYRAAGCPDRRLHPRHGPALAAEIRNLDTVAPWWGTQNPDTIGRATCDAYWIWRRARVKQGATGDRTTELELQTLSNVLTYAVRKGELKNNPILKRGSYRDASNIRHARDVMPAGADELHKIASTLLLDSRSEVHAWMMLLGALTGLRCGELRRLRTDAQRNGLNFQPGYVDEKFLHIAREKRGSNPRIRLDDPERPHIRPLLDKILAWKAARYPENPFLFPGRNDPARLCPEPVTKDSLTKALARIATQLELGERTAHGLRAYYTTVRWGQGIDPEQIAHELGQRSGEDLIRDIYGETPPAWDGLANTFTWLPTTPGIRAAWDTWPTAPDLTNIVPFPAVG